jgi:hypothetical protein
MWSWMFGAALAGDVWLDLSTVDGTETVQLHLPVNAMADDENPSVAMLEGKSVDLRHEVRALRGAKVGTRRTYTVKDDDRLQQVELVVAGEAGPVTELTFRLDGPMGLGVTFSVPLDGSKDASDLKNQVDMDIGSGGMTLNMTDANVEQLRRGGPARVFSVVGQKGRGLTVSTQ